MLNVSLLKRVVQPQESRPHPFRLFCPYTDPEQVDFLRECGGISKYAVVVGLGIEFAVAKDEHPARSTESADVGKEIEMIERDLERLHAAHGESGHRAVIAIGKCTK